MYPQLTNITNIVNAEAPFGLNIGIRKIWDRLTEFKTEYSGNDVVYHFTYPEFIEESGCMIIQGTKDVVLVFPYSRERLLNAYNKWEAIYKEERRKAWKPRGLASEKYKAKK